MPLDDGNEQVAQTFTGTPTLKGVSPRAHDQCRLEGHPTPLYHGYNGEHRRLGSGQGCRRSAQHAGQLPGTAEHRDVRSFDPTNITSQVIEFSRADQDSASDSTVARERSRPTGRGPTQPRYACEGSVDAMVSTVVGKESATAAIDVPKVQVYVYPVAGHRDLHILLDTAITPIEFPAPGSDIFQIPVETISVEGEGMDVDGNTTTETTTTVSNYFVPREGTVPDAGDVDSLRRTNSSKVRIDDTPGCAVILGDFRGRGSETSFTPDLTTEEAAFRTEIHDGRHRVDRSHPATEYGCRIYVPHRQPRCAPRGSVYRRDRGFTLVELLVSIGIFALLMALVSVFMVTIRTGAA